MGTKVFRRVTCVACLALAAAALSGCGRVGNGYAFRARTQGPLAVVLSSDRRSALHVVDLTTGEVLDDVRLRSQCLDIDADARTGLVATAQCGGADVDSDDVVGIYDARRGGAVHYVKTSTRNPGGVTCLDSGRVFVSNGWVDRDGVAVSLVDPVALRVVKDGRVPGLSSHPELVEGRLYGRCAFDDGRPKQLRRIDPVTLESTVVTQGAGAPDAVVGAREGTGAALALTADEGDPQVVAVSVQRFDLIRESATGGCVVPRFREGLGRSATIGDTFAFADFTGMDAGRTGDRVLLTSASDLSRQRWVDTPGGASSIQVLGNRFVVLEQYTGRLLSVEPLTGRVRVLADLDGNEGGYIDVAVLP